MNYQATPERLAIQRMSSMSGGGGGGSGSSQQPTPINLDGRTIIRAFIPYLVEELRRSGAIRSM